ncbi:Pentatricopeptide repeat (PPR) superfamily protein [Euphorbia peplus]|nr:Pentatricopeptide repeat (PPR) superfamily protein [Euphorbia peplus]
MQISEYLHILKSSPRHLISTNAKKSHAHFLKLGIIHTLSISNTLLNSYGKCGLLQSARHMFDEMPQRDPASWASIFTAYIHANQPGTALSLFPNMSKSDTLQPDHFIYATLVKACSSLCALRRGIQVHGHFVRSPFCDDDVVKSSLVDMYAKCGLIKSARAVFDSILVKNAVSWTSIISGYARSGINGEALELFSRVPVKSLYSWTALISGFVQSGNGVDASYLFIEMRRDHRIDIVDPLVISSMIGACANMAVLEFGKQVHCLTILLGFDSCLFVSNALVDMYAKCSDILAAKFIFSEMNERDVVSWTSLIVGAAQHGRAKEAMDLYEDMVLAGIKPNEVTFVGLIYSCSHAGLVTKGKKLFKSMIDDFGINPSLQHYTCLLDLLSRSGNLEEAENLINTMPFKPDEPTWAALLSACIKHKNTRVGLQVAEQMLSLKLEDPSSYILLSNVYAGAGMWENMSRVRKLMAARDVRREPGYSSINLGKETQVFYAGESCHPMKDEMFSLLKELEGEMRRRGYVPDTSCVLHDMEEQEKERQLFWHSERLAVAYGLLKSVKGTTIRIVKNLRVCGDCHTVFKLISSIVQREFVVRDVTRYHHFKDGSCSCSDFW